MDEQERGDKHTCYSVEAMRTIRIYLNEHHPTNKDRNEAEFVVGLLAERDQLVEKLEDYNRRRSQAKRYQRSAARRHKKMEALESQLTTIKAELWASLKHENYHGLYNAISEAFTKLDSGRSTYYHSDPSTKGVEKREQRED